MNVKLDIGEKMTQHEAGVQMIKEVAENLHLAEKEVNEFMADLIGISAKEFSNLDMEDAMRYFDELKKQDIDRFDQRADALAGGIGGVGEGDKLAQ